MKRSNYIRRRRPVFLGCEGESERAYAQFLNDIIRNSVSDVHLEAMLIGEGAGDPLAKLRKSTKMIENFERKRTKFWLRAVLIDSDIAGDERTRAETERLATENEIAIIWQNPCHEAFLLRHLLGCENRRPQTTALAASSLQREWPDYRKPMTRARIETRLNDAAVRRAVTVEDGLRQFLANLGWR